MTFTVELSPRAEFDIEESFGYIANDSFQNALSWRFDLEEKLRSLSQFPERCVLAPECSRVRIKLHQLCHGNYRALFIIRDQTVYVLTIRHGARKMVSKTEIDRLM